MLLGAHVSVAGGLASGPPNGVDLGCDVIQVFTRNQRQWTHKPVTDEEAQAFKASYRGSGLKGVMAHASYLMILASPKKDVWAKSLKALQEEATRCGRLGIDRFVFHPGAHLDSPLEEGRTRIAKALRTTLDATEGSGVRILLETMAGQGTTIGHDLRDLAAIIDQAGADKRLGVCVDTCHVFAAGHDLSTPEGYDALMAALDEAVGVKRIHAFHLNDSKMACGMKRDRHEIIGDGQIGLDGFRPLMNDARFAKVPMALETPGGDDGYRLGLKRLRRLMGP
jgi:deoxyribonuclease-4